MAAKGLARLNRQIKAIPELQIRAASEALAQGADELVDAMKRIAPHGYTGELASSIGWAWANEALDGSSPPKTERGQASRERTVALGTSKLALVVSAGSKKAYYVRWVEFGTSYHPAKNKPDSQAHNATPPQPFFWPAIRAWKARVKSRVVRNANKAAKAAARVT